MGLELLKKNKKTKTQQQQQQQGYTRVETRISLDGLVEVVRELLVKVTASKSSLQSIIKPDQESQQKARREFQSGPDQKNKSRILCQITSESGYWPLPK